HQRALPVSERLRALCGFFNRTGPGVWSREVWKGHRDRVEWLYWYWEERGRRRKEEVRKMAEDVIMADRILGEGCGEVVGAKEGEENGLTKEEKEMVQKLEAEMAEEVDEGENGGVKTDEDTLVRDVNEEEMMGEGVMEAVTWAAKVVNGNRGWKSMKRKRE
ncbi:MAG: hypothetical protein Q9225_006210, partial [Loekoesia sp. 1 TL-2023]